MNTLLSPIEQLEPRLAPAGLIAVSVTAAGTLTLATVAGQDGDESLTIDRLDDGSYQLTPAAGVTLRIGGNNFVTAQILSGINGLTANLGAGSDSILLSDCFFTKAVTVNLGTGNNAFTMSESTIGGALMLTTTDGNDTVSFIGNFNAVGGPATIKLGIGTDTVTSSSNRLAFGASLTVDGGTGNDTLSLATSDSDDLRILGNLNFIAGAGDDTLTVGTTNTTVTISGSLQVTDVSGNETLTFAGTRIDAGALLFQLGSGDHTLSSTATDLFIARNLLWKSTAGVDNLDITGTTLRVGTNVDISIGAGGGAVELDPGSSFYAGGFVTMTSAATAGAARELSITTNEVTIGGKSTITGGLGDGILRIFTNTSILLGAGATITSGAGASTLGITTNGTLISNGAISFTAAGGDSTLNVFSSSAGDSVINGAVTLKGGDFVQLQMAGIVTGPVNLTTSATPVDNPIINLTSNGTDGLQLAGAATISLPTPTGRSGIIGVSSVIFESTISFLGGAGADTLRIDGSDFEKAMTASLGAGADHFDLEQSALSGSSNFRATALFNGGAGADVFLLGGNAAANAVNFFKTTTADGGTETDSITIGTQTTFAPGLPLIQKSIP